METPCTSVPPLTADEASPSALVEVAGIEPASAGLLVGLLRAQLSEGFRVRGSVSNHPVPYPALISLLADRRSY